MRIYFKPGRLTIIISASVIIFSDVFAASVMPEFVQSNVTDAKKDGTLVFRYYSPLDIKTILNPPDVVTQSGTKIKVYPIFNYADPGYLRGQIDGGFDQYTQYFFAQIPAYSGNITISGQFQPAAYFSATFQSSSSSLVATKDNQFFVKKGQNPYIVGNPSVFSYTNQRVMVPKPNPTIVNRSKNPFKTKNIIPLYRMDQFSTRTRWAEDPAPDGCSRAYISTKEDGVLPKYMLLRYKLPRTFIQRNINDLVFGQYEAREISVSSTMKNLKDDLPVIDYFSVNSNMMSASMDSKGYAFVVFAPREYVDQLAKNQKLAPRTPPSLSFLGTSAYVLGWPTNAVIIRYRDPERSWAGSPENARCYRDLTAAQPIGNDELGDYRPLLIGADSFEELNSVVTWGLDHGF